MTKLALALLVATSCLCGLTGVAAGVWLVGHATPVAAAPMPPVKMALLDLEKVARSSKLFVQRKSDYDAAQKWVRDNIAWRAAELDTLKEQLADAKRVDEDLAHELEIATKAKEQEIEFTNGCWKHYLDELRLVYMKQVLRLALSKSHKYADDNGYNVVFQEFDLNDAGIFSERQWSETLLAKPIIHTPVLDPYITDITDEVIKTK